MADLTELEIKKEDKRECKKTPPPPSNENVQHIITQKARESGIVPSDSKEQGFGGKIPNETIMPRR